MEDSTEFMDLISEGEKIITDYFGGNRVSVQRLYEIAVAATLTLGPFVSVENTDGPAADLARLWDHIQYIVEGEPDGS